MGRWRAVAALLRRNQLLNSSKPSSSPPCLWKRSTIGSQASPFLNFRRFSAFPSPISIYNNDSDSGSGDVYQSYDFGTKEEEDRGKIPIKAYFLSTRFVLTALNVFETLSSFNLLVMSYVVFCFFCFVSFYDFFLGLLRVMVLAVLI